jgi:hypothetical protein
MADFAAIDKDGDNSLSFVEVRKWVEEKAKKDPNWSIFIADGAPVLPIAHKMAAMRSGDKTSHVTAARVVSVQDFKTLLIQMFAIAILWSHFKSSVDWASAEGTSVDGKELTFESFRLAVRTLTSTHAQEELTDDELEADFNEIDKNGSGTIGFHELCNFCCKFIDDPQVRVRTHMWRHASKARVTHSHATCPCALPSCRRLTRRSKTPTCGGGPSRRWPSPTSFSATWVTGPSVTLSPSSTAKPLKARKITLKG